MIKVFLGDDIGLNQEEAKEAIKEELGTVTEFNFESYDLYNDLIQDVIASAESVSFMADKKCILIKNAYFLSSDMNKPQHAWDAKQDYKRLAGYIEHQNPDCSLYFVGQGKLTGIQSNPAVKALKKSAGIVSSGRLRPEEMAQKGLRYVGEKRKNISHEALVELVSRCTGGWLMLKNSLDKLMTYTSNISLNDVKALVLPRVEDSIFSVISYLFHNDVRHALSSYRDLRKGGNDPIALLPVFASQMRFFYLTAYLLEQRKNDLDIARELGLTNTYRVRYARRDIGRLSSKTILKMMNDLGIIEDDIKFKGDDADTVLEIYLTDFRRNYLQ